MSAMIAESLSVTIQGENSQCKGFYSRVLKDNGRRRCRRHMKTRPKRVIIQASEIPFTRIRVVHRIRVVSVSLRSFLLLTLFL